MYNTLLDIDLDLKNVDSANSQIDLNIKVFVCFTKLFKISALFCIFHSHCFIH